MKGFIVVAVGIMMSLAGTPAARAGSYMTNEGQVVTDHKPAVSVSAPRAGDGEGSESHPCMATTIGQIDLDGCPDDWHRAGIRPLINDPHGDMEPAGLDFRRLYVTNDEEFLYLLVEFAGPPVDSSFLLLNTDGNNYTGCAPGMGFEFGVTSSPVSPPENSYIGDARDCSWGGDDFPGALKYVVRGNFIEASIPLTVLNALGPVSEIEFFCGNDPCAPERYAMKNGRTPVGGTVQGLKPLILGRYLAVCINQTTGQEVQELVVDREWDCEAMGLRISSGDVVFTGGTGVVSP